MSMILIFLSIIYLIFLGMRSVYFSDYSCYVIESHFEHEDKARTFFIVRKKSLFVPYWLSKKTKLVCCPKSWHTIKEEKSVQFCFLTSCGKQIPRFFRQIESYKNLELEKDRAQWAQKALSEYIESQYIDEKPKALKSSFSNEIARKHWGFEKNEFNDLNQKRKKAV